MAVADGHLPRIPPYWAGRRRWVRVPSSSSKGTAVTGFIIIGGVGLLLILVSLFLHDIFEGLFDALHVDAGGGLFSTPVIGAFLAAFGWGGALAVWGGGTGVVAGSAAGAASGVVLGYVTLWVTRALMRMPTDETPRIADLVGKGATVITAIPAQGFGEIRIRHLGLPMKLSARAAEPITSGTAVVVTKVMSASSVLVEPEASFFGTLPEEQEH